MAKQVYPSDLPYPFSAAVRTGNLLFVSGQVGMRGGKVADGIEAQTRATLENIRDVLAQAGASLEDVVKVTVFITDMALWPAMNEVYREYFPQLTAVALVTYGALVAFVPAVLPTMM